MRLILPTIWVTATFCVYLFANYSGVLSEAHAIIKYEHSCIFVYQWTLYLMRTEPSTKQSTFCLHAFTEVKVTNIWAAFFDVDSHTPPGHTQGLKQNNQLAHTTFTCKCKITIIGFMLVAKSRKKLCTQDAQHSRMHDISLGPFHTVNPRIRSANLKRGHLFHFSNSTLIMTLSLYQVNTNYKHLARTYVIVQ